MFRRTIGRPRHLAYNRNLSYLNQFSGLESYLPFGNTGGFPGVFSAASPPSNTGFNGWNQTGIFPNYMDANQSYQGVQGFAFQGVPGYSSQGVPFPNMPSPQNGVNSFIGAGMMPGGIPSMQQGTLPPQMNMMQPPSPAFMNPYPTQNQSVKPQSSQVQSFMNQFKGQDGSVDMKKMMDTAGQMMNTVNQLNNMVKGIAATFKA